MFKETEELKSYVIENYPEVTDHRIDANHWDLECTTCKVTRGFQFIRRHISNELSPEYRAYMRDYAAPITYLFRCPVCGSFKQWIVYELSLPDEDGQHHKHYFKVTSVPSEGLENIEELPVDPPSLRIAYRQAIRAMDANAQLAAAAMFRRAVQIITRDILGANAGTLAAELKEIVGRNYNGAAISTDFADNGYIIKQAGNQGAHPDKDPDLLDFSAEDAADLQRIFLNMVSELFVVPAAAKKAKDAFLARRKIDPAK